MVTSKATKAKQGCRSSQSSQGGEALLLSVCCVLPLYLSPCSLTFSADVMGYLWALAQGGICQWQPAWSCSCWALESPWSQSLRGNSPENLVKVLLSSTRDCFPETIGQMDVCYKLPKGLTFVANKCWCLNLCPFHISSSVLSHSCASLGGIRVVNNRAILCF